MLSLYIFSFGNFGLINVINNMGLIIILAIIILIAVANGNRQDSILKNSLSETRRRVCRRMVWNIIFFVGSMYILFKGIQWSHEGCLLCGILGTCEAIVGGVLSFITFLTTINSILGYRKFLSMNETQYACLQQEIKMKLEKDMEDLKKAKRLKTAFNIGYWIGGQF